MGFLNPFEWLLTAGTGGIYPLAKAGLQLANRTAGSVPTVEAPEAVPTPEKVDVVDEVEGMRKRRGRAANILGGTDLSGNSASTANISRRTLLGS